MPTQPLGTPPNQLQDFWNQYQSFGHDPSYQNIGDFPSWLQGNGTAPLTQLQGELGKFYNFAPIRKTATRSIDSNFNMARTAAAAAATGAQNRAAQQGGAVGADFARAGALTPLFNQKNQMNTQLAQIQAAMRQAQAQQRGTIAGQLTSAELQHQGILSDYTTREQALQQALFNSANRGGFGNFGLSGGGGGGSGGGGMLMPGGSWVTDNLGHGMTPADQMRMHDYYTQRDLYNANASGGPSKGGLSYSMPVGPSRPAPSGPSASSANAASQNYQDWWNQKSNAQNASMAAPAGTGMSGGSAYAPGVNPMWRF